MREGVPVGRHRRRGLEDADAQNRAGVPGRRVRDVFRAQRVGVGAGGAPARAPFGTLAALALMWFGVSLPLVFVGSYLGHKAPVPEPPTRTNKIPRQVPPSASGAILGHPVAIALAGGALPFGAVFIELFFILTSMWLHQPYYLFGILALVLVILVVTCAEIAIVLCYFQLCAEDYHWWWRAFCARRRRGRTSSRTARITFSPRSTSPARCRA